MIEIISVNSAIFAHLIYTHTPRKSNSYLFCRIRNTLPDPYDTCRYWQSYQPRRILGATTERISVHYLLWRAADWAGATRQEEITMNVLHYYRYFRIVLPGNWME